MTGADPETMECVRDVVRRHGDDALAFIAGKIGACADVGDEDGVERWKAVLSHLLSPLDVAASS